MLFSIKRFLLNIQNILTFEIWTLKKYNRNIMPTNIIFNLKRKIACSLLRALIKVGTVNIGKSNIFVLNSRNAKNSTQMFCDTYKWWCVRKYVKSFQWLPLDCLLFLLLCSKHLFIYLLVLKFLYLCLLICRY